MAIDITTIGIEYDTSGLVRGTRAQNAATDSANKLFGALLAVTGALGVSQILDQVDAYTKYTAQLKLATGSTQEYAASLNIVRQISKDSQAALAGTGMLYARIANGTRELGVAQSQVAKITEVVNLGLKVSGATANEAASAQLQLSQAFASGTLRGEEFNAVNEAAPRLMKALADGMGLPVGALKEMASNGLITSEIMSRVLPASLEKLREEAKQVQTISGAMQVLKNNTLEFIGVQAHANGAVSIVTGAIGLLADNLGILAGAIITVTATKIANFMASLATSTYTTIAANRALAVSNLETTTTNVTATASTLALAEARVIELRQAVLAASGETALAITLNGLIPAQTRAAAASVAHAEALAAQAVAAGAASTSAGILRGALAFLGGPIGMIVAALGVAATAWFVFGNKAKEANDTASESTIASADTIIKKLDAQIERHDTIIKLRKEGMSLDSAKNADLAQIKTLQDLGKSLTDLNARAGEFQKITMSNDDVTMKRLELLGKINDITKKINEEKVKGEKALSLTTDDKMKKWLGDNGSAAQRMAAAFAEAKKEVGVLTPEMEKLIKAKFADKNIAKEAAFEESARHKMFMAHVKAEQSIQDQINKDAKQFTSEQIARTKEVTKEIIAGINEQSKAFLSYNKSLDDHAQRMSDMNTLAQLEIDTLGMSSVQRNTLIEQKKIELTLNRQLLEIENLKISQGDKNILKEKAKTQANIDKSTAELRAQQGEWTKFYGEIYNGLSDSLYRGFEAGKGFGKSFLDSIKNLLKTNVLKISVQAVMGGATGTLSSMAQAFGGESGGSSGGVGSYISMGKSIYEGFSGGFSGFGNSVANYVQAGLDKAGLSMTGGGNSAFASGAGTAASYAGGAAVGVYGGRAISGGYSVTGGNAAVNTGTAIGAIWGPIGMAIGGAIGGLVNRAFGRKADKLQQSELSGSFGGDGFSGSVRDVYKAEGGWFSGDKWSEKVNPVGDTKSLTDAFMSIKSAASGYASILGLSAESLNNFSKDFKVNLSITGDAAKDAAANEKIMTDLINGLSNDISNFLAPSLSKFAKDGEQAAETLARLSNSLLTVNGIMSSVGISEFAKSLEGASAAERLAELTGGIEKLATGAQYFFENFLTDAEKLKPSADLVTATMARLGQSAVDTIPEFKTLVQGLDLASESGAKMYAELIAIAPQFKAVADSNAAEELRKLNEATKELEIVAQKAKVIADERKSLQEEYNQLTMTTTQLMELQRSTIDQSNLARYDEIQALKARSAAEAQAAEQARAIAGQRAALQDELDQLTMTEAQLIEKKRATYYEQNLDIFDQIQAEKARAVQLQADAKFKEELARAQAEQQALFLRQQEESARRDEAAANQAQDAANQIAKAWQGLTDSVYDEVKRIRGLMSSNTSMGFASAQTAFTIASAKASAGDQAAYKSLPDLSKALLSIAEQQAPTLDALRMIQAQTAASLLATSAKLGFQLPSFAVGTDYVPKDMIAQIHEGERIVPKAYNNSANKSDSVDKTLIRDLIQRVEMLSFELKAIAGHTSSTARNLDRVIIDDKMQIATPQGEPIETTAV